MKYYDITFHGVSGRAVVKRTVPSDKAPFDACTKVTATELQLMVNKSNVIIYRQHLARIDVEEVTDPIDQAQKRKDEFMTVVNTLSNMGF